MPEYIFKWEKIGDERWLLFCNGTILSAEIGPCPGDNPPCQYIVKTMYAEFANDITTAKKLAKDSLINSWQKKIAALSDLR